MKSKNIESFILKILKKIEEIFPSVVCYAYKTEMGWWEVSISDFDIYRDKRFRVFTDAWYKAGLKYGSKIIFVCGWIPKESTLVKLAEQNNLILNI